MTRSGAPFHGAHGEGRSAISPAALQVGAEPCARAFPAARARRNAPVISDNAVVAATINWRAESTGNPLPLSRPATQLAENHGKSRSAKRISAALLPWKLEARPDQDSPPESAISCGPCQTVTFIRAWAPQNEFQLQHP